MDNRIEIRPGRFINIVTHQHPTSDTTVFLFHGLGGRGEQWRLQLDLFKSLYNVIIPDMLGHGNSDKPLSHDQNNYSFTALELDLQAVFKRYASESNIIIGHSYGGAFATSITLDHQDQVKKLILIAPTPCEGAIQIPWIYELPPFALKIFRYVLDKQFEQVAFLPSDNAALLAEEAAAREKNSIAVVTATVKGFKQIPHIDVTMLTVPTLIILGEHERLLSVPAIKSFYGAIPHHRFESVANTSHMVMLEQPEPVNKLIMDFLTH